MSDTPGLPTIVYNSGGGYGSGGGSGLGGPNESIIVVLGRSRPMSYKAMATLGS